MTKNNGKPRHFDVLVPSTPDDVALGMAMDERFLVLCGRHERSTGNDLVFPESMNRDVLRWRQMRVRHKAGDYRHTEAELRSARTVGQWLVDTNDVICGQPVGKPIQWEK